MTAPKPDEDARQPRPFADVLREIDNGRFAADVAARLVEVAEGVTSTGKTGSLTIRIKVTPASKNSTDALVVSGEAVAKIPVDPPGASVFFPDSDGNLRRDNPHQPELPLRDVSVAPAAERPVRHIKEG